VWATMFAFGMAAGPVVGGTLLAHFWWGAAFLVAVPVVGLLLVFAPFLLPEYRASSSGKLDLPSVVLSLAAMLPVIYGIKQFAKDGPDPGPLGAIVLGLVLGLVFVRRQRRLADPLLDLSLFADKAFSVALIVLLFGLIAVGGTMLLVTQYLQLVAGYSPWIAGLWMGPPALAMVAAGVGAPLLARRMRPGFVVAGALGFSAAGYLLLTQLSADARGTGIVVAGFSLAYLGLGVIAALGTDLVIAAAPASRAGSASAMSETVQELGASLGIAVLGSLVTAIYRVRVAGKIPEDASPETRQAVGDSLWAASSIAQRLPDGLLDEARVAFTLGFHTAAAASAIGVAILAVLAAMTLRHVGVLGSGAAARG
jgi:DHA2 family multidrug resistance protein-like MFS transporter